jgi:hypothetical protein
MKKAMNVEHSVSGITLTRENASRFANRLKKSLKTEGIVLPLNRCHEHLAQTFGASTWHELNENLKKDEQRALEQMVPVDTVVSENSPSLMNLEWVEFEYVINRMLNSFAKSPNEIDINAIWYILKMNRNFDNPLVDLDWDSLSKQDNEYNDMVDRLYWVAEENIAISDLLSKKYADTVPMKIQSDYKKFIRKGKLLNLNYIREVLVFLKWLFKNNLMLYRYENEDMLREIVSFKQIENQIYLESTYPFLNRWCYGYSLISLRLKKEQQNLNLHQAIIRAFLHDEDNTREVANMCYFLINKHEMAVNAWKKIPESYRGKITD